MRAIPLSERESDVRYEEIRIARFEGFLRKRPRGAKRRKRERTAKGMDGAAGLCNFRRRAGKRRFVSLFVGRNNVTAARAHRHERLFTGIVKSRTKVR